MREFKSLNPVGLPGGFDAEVHGEEPIVKVEELKGKIVLAFIFPGFYLSDDRRNVEGEKLLFKQCNIAKTGFFTESGRPLLPSFGRYVQIAFESSYSVTVKKGNPVHFDDILILPAQQQVTDSPKAKHVFEYDRDFYKKDVLYPAEIVEVTGPYEIDGYNSLLVHVRPFQYIPSRRRLIGYGSITVEITVKGDKPKSRAQFSSDPELNREGYGNLHLNPRRGINDRLEMAPVEVVTPFALRGPEFLIVYDANLKAAAEKLALWKNRRGLETETVSIAVIGNNTRKIKDYIRERRKAVRSRLRYVLLFGDVGAITSESIAGDNVVTDYYYSTETDSINGNYLLPWLSIGRIPVSTREQAMAVAREIIGYEKNPPAEADYYRRMTFGAYFQDIEPKDDVDDRCYMKTMEDIRGHMIKLGFKVNRVYVSDSPNPSAFCDGAPVPADVKAAFIDENAASLAMISATTKGNLIIGHRDHGDWDGWVHPSFNTGHLDSVTGTMPTLFYSINCLTGQFDLNNPTECFAEKTLRMKGGAPSLIAATRVSGTWRNHSLIKGLFDAVWAGVIATFPGSTASYPVRQRRLGDILNYAKSYLPVKHSGESEGIKNHFEIYHVIGDPTLEIWNAKPVLVSVKAFFEQRALYIVLSSCPKDAVITLWINDTLIKRIEPSSNSIKINADQFGLFSEQPVQEPLRAAICFWAPGCRYREVAMKYENGKWQKATR